VAVAVGAGGLLDAGGVVAITGVPLGIALGGAVPVHATLMAPTRINAVDRWIFIAVAS
jgi:hypothetical protein